MRDGRLLSQVLCLRFKMSFKPAPIIDIGQWQQPQGSRKRSRKKRKKEDGSEIPLSNSFEALSSEEMDTTQDSKESQINEEKVKTKIPPLVIYNNIENHVKTLNEMKKDLTDEISLKCKSNRIIIYTKNIQDYNKMREKIAAAQVQYHTYSLDSEKPITTILKGLPNNITIEEILQDLAEKNLQVIEVKQFLKKVETTPGCFKEYKLPIYRVRFHENTKVADFKKYRSVCFCKISWEKNLRKKLVTQCFKCQSFGHIAKNCFKNEICANCADKHNTKECSNPKNYKCANCSGPHPSYDTECQHYKKIIAAKSNVMRNRFDPMFIDDDIRSCSSANTVMQSRDVDSRNSKPSTSFERPKYSRVVDAGKNKQHMEENNDSSVSSIFQELKTLFKSINFNRILVILKKVNKDLKKCNDTMSKFSCLLEGLAEIFD